MRPNAWYPASRPTLDPKAATRWRKRSGASEVARALALLTQRGPVRARGGVFIRSRPPSCAGDRTFRMGTKMGGIGHLAGLFGEFGVDGRNLPPAKSRGNSGTDLEGRRVTPMRPMADSGRGQLPVNSGSEPWRTKMPRRSRSSGPESAAFTSGRIGHCRLQAAPPGYR